MVGKKETKSAQLQSARRLCEQEVMKLPGVNMVSESEVRGKPYLVVYIEKEDEGLRKRIQSHYRGIPVRIEVAGEIKAL